MGDGWEMGMGKAERETWHPQDWVSGTKPRKAGQGRAVRPPA